MSYHFWIQASRPRSQSSVDSDATTIDEAVESVFPICRPGTRRNHRIFWSAIMNWKKMQLHGADGIAKLCGVYELTDAHRLPGGKFKIKVLERTDDFIAVPNVCTKSEGGQPEWICGLGATELEALQDAIERIMLDLSSKDEWGEEDLEWSDPRDF
jgi:hypothetical protein